MDYLISLAPPENHTPVIEAAGCICRYQNKILLLRRHPDILHGNCWTEPAGKLEKNEDPKTAAIREAYEEAGLILDGDKIEKITQFYIQWSDKKFIYHMFHTQFLVIPSITLDFKEHLEARWVTIEEALQLPLIVGGKEALLFYEQFIRDYAC
ncbi:MAG TPA: NUDIX hydrolase [Rhabdochlamydiaceae bacterium]|nr:NUDIX hydrolase [Rhabdochlamydiaceae bacterium]